MYSVPAEDKAVFTSGQLDGCFTEGAAPLRSFGVKTSSYAALNKRFAYALNKRASPTSNALSSSLMPLFLQTTRRRRSRSRRRTWRRSRGTRTTTADTVEAETWPACLAWRTRSSRPRRTSVTWTTSASWALMFPSPSWTMTTTKVLNSRCVRLYFHCFLLFDVY